MTDVIHTVRLGYDDDRPVPAVIPRPIQPMRRQPMSSWAPHYSADMAPSQEPLIPHMPPHVHSPPWGAWRWLILLQGLAIIGLAVGLILVASSHSDPAPIATRDTGVHLVRSVPVGGYLEPSKLPPPSERTQRKSYSFTITGVYARYPTEGGGINKLDVGAAKEAQCCCKYRIMGKTMREAHTCTKVGDSDNRLLHFKLQRDDEGGHLLVNAGKDLLEAQCTLSWI